VAGAGVEAAGRTAEQKLAAAHEALLHTKGVQFDFAAAPPPPDLSWLEPLLKFLTAIGPYVAYVFWGGLALGVALVLYFVIRELVPERWLRGKRQAPAATDWRPDAEQAEALLADADALASDGRFEEAIHILLFRSIDDLAARRPGVVRQALTSRDIAGLEVLPPAARAAFARLAQAVERTFFGGRAADAEIFGRARADYEAFAFAEGWR
jgi:hypothetical protein